MRNNFHENLTEFDVVHTSNRAFGLTFMGIFFGLGLLPVLHRHSPHFWLLGLGLGMLALSYLKPSWLTKPNYAWSKVGLGLGKIMTPLILGVLFYGILTPIAIVFRMKGKDLLALRLDADKASYWIERDPPGPTPESLRQQF